MRLFVALVGALALAGCIVDPETVSGKLVAVRWSGSPTSLWWCRALIEPVNGNEQSGWAYNGYNATVCHEAERLLGRCVFLHHADVGKTVGPGGQHAQGPTDGIVWTREDAGGCRA